MLMCLLCLLFAFNFHFFIFQVGLTFLHDAAGNSGRQIYVYTSKKYFFFNLLFNLSLAYKLVEYCGIA